MLLNTLSCKWCVSKLMNVTLYEKTFNARDKCVNECQISKMNVFFWLNVFEVGVRDCIFSSNEQQKL